MTPESPASAPTSWNPISEVRDRMARLLWRFLFWAITPFVVFIVLMTMIPGDGTRWIWAEAICHAGFLAIYPLVRRRRPEWLGHLAVLWGVVMLTLAQAHWGPQMGLGMAWVGVAVMTQFFVGTTAAALMVILFAVVFLGQGIAISMGVGTPPDPRLFDLSLRVNWIRLGISGMLSMSVFVLVFRSLQEALEAAVGREMLEREARHAAQASAEAAQRLEAIGHLASGVTHDVNNVLTVIMAASEEIQELTEEEDVRALAEEMVTTALGAAEVTQQLLVLGRPPKSSAGSVDVRELVQWLDRSLRRLLPPDITLRTGCSTDRIVQGDAALLQQALLNLVLNARDAMPEGGEIHVLIGDASGVEGRPAPHVQITVSDTGTGIPPETLGRIFEPFFTTKERGKGTGLGLSMVRTSIEAMGGSVTVDSAPGIGTTFRLFLPVAPGRAVEAAVRTRSRGEGRILLVEARADLRSVLSGVLVRAGYTVHEADSVGSALQLLATLRDQRELPDLVSADTVLEDGSVTPILDWLATGARETRVLLHGTPAGRPAVMMDRSRYLFLPKPFSASQFLETVREALGAPRALS